MTTERSSRKEFQAIRGLLADAALDRALIGLDRLDLSLKNWETQPRAPAGQPDGGRWVTGPGGVPIRMPPTSWTSLRDGEPSTDQPRQAQTESTTLEDGSRVLSIRVRNRRGQIDEQHVVIAPDGESRIFENDGLTQTIRDGFSGDVISQATFTPSKIQLDLNINPVLFRPEPARKAAIATFEFALSLFAALSGRKKMGSVPCWA